MSRPEENNTENNDNLQPQAEDNTSAPSSLTSDENTSASTNRTAELEAEIARLKDHMLRALADAENTRKRAIKEREDASKFAVTAFARDMLDIADNFRRALDAIPADAQNAGDPLVKTMLEGLDATERALLKIFEKHGIRKLEPMGERFDPNFHEVMFEAPIPGQSAGTVIQLIEPGYILNDRLLRPARVGVAKGDPAGDNGPSHQVDESV